MGPGAGFPLANGVLALGDAVPLVELVSDGMEGLEEGKDLSQKGRGVLDVGGFTVVGHELEQIRLEGGGPGGQEISLDRGAGEEDVH